MKFLITVLMLVTFVAQAWEITYIKNNNDEYLQFISEEVAYKVRIEDFRQTECVTRKFDGTFAKNIGEKWTDKQGDAISCALEKWINGCRLVIRIKGSFTTWKKVNCDINKKYLYEFMEKK